MKKLICRTYVFLAAAITGVVAAAFVFVLKIQEYELLLSMLLSTTMLLAIFLAQTLKSRKAARLIIENQILHIQPIVTDCGERWRKKEGSSIKAIEVFVSCFGILLDNKIIRFNQDNVHLKEIEIGRDYICLTYGTDRRKHKTQLLHALIDNQEMNKIIDKFHYETGVIPKITSG